MESKNPIPACDCTSLDRDSLIGSCRELLDAFVVTSRNTGSFDLFAVRQRTANCAQDDIELGVRR